ncbi:MAG: ABC transporter ATP-binding protein [Alphaproteobacteria bacterium]|nr:ABC transporter ATP-binding protein [Alphaproteobacteria bacterium]
MAGSPILQVRGLAKTYAGGFQALKPTDLEIRAGEIFALLGPNGAGKTTLIGLICGLIRPTAGTVSVGGFDHVRAYRQARALIGLAPQELATDAFESVWATVRFSRALFGKPRDDAYLRRLLEDLALWDKKDSPIMALSGGMKRRVMIAKALAHEPRLLFLDEPSAGVDVELRREMWGLVRRLRDAGVTIVLTTHYIEEAEDLADRVGVIAKGALILADDKEALMRRMGRREISLHLTTPLAALPDGLSDLPLERVDDGARLVYAFDARGEAASVSVLIRRLSAEGIEVRDLETRESSLEDIFVGLVGGPR